MKTFVKEAAGLEEKPVTTGIKDFKWSFVLGEKKSKDDISLLLSGKGRNVCNNEVNFPVTYLTNYFSEFCANLSTFCSKKNQP